MCGIAGVWKGGNLDGLRDTAELMVGSLEHRGPDGDGVWIDPQRRLALVHTRLSIVDLSSAGAQPMISHCGNYVLVFNGEIYNHRELRERLVRSALSVWRGHSDTETLLYALVHWGVERTLEAVNGMFAFAFFNIADQSLVLARDKMGEKPLYFGQSGNEFVFASELKAITKVTGWKGRIDRNALADFFRFGYVPAPASIFQDIFKLDPGAYLNVEFDKTVQITRHIYYDPYCNYLSAKDSTGDEDLLDRLEQLLGESVSKRLLADVPVGCFLSGGVDSSLIASVMSNVSDATIDTFSLGFAESKYDEAAHAAKVASHLRTNHYQLYLSSDDALNVVHLLPTLYDEPFADSSQIPMYLLARFAREKVTVCLSGDGGDELFFGYNRYFRSEQIWRVAQLIPHKFRGAIFEVLVGQGLDVAHAMTSKIPFLSAGGRQVHRLQKISNTLNSTSKNEVFEKLSAIGHSDLTLVRDAVKRNYEWMGKLEADFGLDTRKRMMLSDIYSYLPSDILTKVDRATMAVGLEARVPFLDPRLVDFALSVPASKNYDGSKGKLLLRQLLARHLPEHLIVNKKRGFSVPLQSWLSGDLREWADELLNPEKLESQGFIESNIVAAMWREQKKGTARFEHQIWAILMFQSWLESQEVYS